MRMIDADKFILALMDASLSSVDEDTILDLVDSIPTVDAVPVVRCRECKHYKSSKAGLVKSCFNDIWNQEFAVPTTPDDFCSYGERKEGADHEAD